MEIRELSVENFRHIQCGFNDYQGLRILWTELEDSHLRMLPFYHEVRPKYSRSDLKKLKTDCVIILVVVQTEPVPKDCEFQFACSNNDACHLLSGCFHRFLFLLPDWSLVKLCLRCQSRRKVEVDDEWFAVLEALLSAIGKDDTVFF